MLTKICTYNSIVLIIAYFFVIAMLAYTIAYTMSMICLPRVSASSMV